LAPPRFCRTYLCACMREVIYWAIFQPLDEPPIPLSPYIFQLSGSSTIRSLHFCDMAAAARLLGMYGVKSFLLTINPPETAILGVGAISEKPVIVEGEVRASFNACDLFL